jgi:hypothetical protein
LDAEIDHIFLVPKFFLGTEKQGLGITEAILTFDDLRVTGSIGNFDGDKVGLNVVHVALELLEKLPTAFVAFRIGDTSYDIELVFVDHFIVQSKHRSPKEKGCNHTI